MSTRASTGEVTATLADFVARTSFDALPREVVHTARRMILDVVGVAIAGAADSLFSPVRALSTAAGSGEVPTPVAKRLDAPWAALVVGSAAHLLDYDDVHTLCGHPSATLLPVAFSLGYLLHSSGSEVIRAFALGAEVEARVGAAINPAHYSIGWHPTSVIGALGAAAAASCLLGLNAEETRRAFGIAASHSSGTKANFGTSVKSLHAGMAGRAGVEAALFARAGATANDRILDQQFGGFCELFTTSADRSKMIDRLGERYLLLDPGVGFKLLPCCGSTQAAVWAVIDLWQAHRLDPKRIRSIRTRVDKRRLDHTNRPRVATGLEGKFSTQYCQAVAALRGALGLADFEDEVVLEPDRQEMMRRVELTAAQDASDWFDAASSGTGSRAASVEIELDDGTVYHTFSRGPRGYPALPASDDDLRVKFLDCAGRGLDADSAGRLADRLLDLESVPDLAPIVEAAWKRVMSDE